MAFRSTTNRTNTNRTTASDTTTDHTTGASVRSSEGGVGEPVRGSGTWQPDLTARHHDLERIEHVAFVPMPPHLRNELITEAYGDLADAMRLVVGSSDATWCTFGQWASHAVGGVLRLPAGRVGRLIGNAFGEGNRLVFADVGRAHSVFLATVGAAAASDTDLDVAWQRCRRELSRRILEPPGGPAVTASAPLLLRQLLLADHPDSRRMLLVRGFQAYREAIDMTEPESRSRHILLGNALIAVHEQQRLSSVITIGFRSWLRHLTTLHQPFLTRHQWRNQDPRPWRLRLEDAWIRTATARFVGIDLPDRRIAVGRPSGRGPNAVAIPTPRSPLPDDTTGPLDDIANDELLAFVYATFAVDGRPATFWAALGDRMGSILGMFADEQRSDALITTSGILRRPVPRPERIAELDAFESRLVEREPDRGTCPAAVLDHARLDELRATATHTVIDDVTGLSFRAVGARQTDHVDLASFEADMEQRRAAVSGPGQVADPATIRLARTLYGEWTTLVHMGLLFRSLPDGYAAARGVRVLGVVSDLATDPVRRVGETGHFLDDLFADPSTWTGDGDTLAMDPDGAGFVSICGVRLMHALVGHQLMGSLDRAHDDRARHDSDEDGWNVDELGPPVNAEDLLGTTLSFVVPVFEMIDDLGLSIPDDQREAYTRCWCAIGHLLGLPLDAVTVEEPGGGRRAYRYDEARAMAERIRWRQHDRSLDGVRLAEALVAGVGDGFPRFFDWVGIGLFQAVGNSDVNRLLLIGEGRGRRRSEYIARGIAASLGHPLTRRPAAAAVRSAGRFWLAPFLAEGSARPYRRPLSESEQGRPFAPDPMVLDSAYWPLGPSGPT